MAEQQFELVGLVESLVRPLVDHEEDLQITSSVNDDCETIEIRVNAEDAGKVIGKQGRVIKSVRTLTRAAASRHGLTAEVEIIDS